MKPWYLQSRLQWTLYLAFCKVRHWLFVKLGIWREIPKHWPKIEIQWPDDTHAVDAFTFSVRSSMKYDLPTKKDYYIGVDYSKNS